VIKGLGCSTYLHDERSQNTTQNSQTPTMMTTHFYPFYGQYGLSVAAWHQILHNGSMDIVKGHKHDNLSNQGLTNMIILSNWWILDDKIGPRA